MGKIRHEYRKQRSSKRRLATHKRRLDEQVIECPECRGYGSECDTCLGEGEVEKS